jgi:hypothetical protein
MSMPANRQYKHLPKQFPVGSTYVVEGHGGENGQLLVFSRYVVLPGGQRINVAADFGGPASPRRGHSRRNSKSQPQRSSKSRTARAKKFRCAQEPGVTSAVDVQAPGEAPQPLTLNHPASSPGRFSGRGSSFQGWRFPTALPGTRIHHPLVMPKGT